MTRMHVGEVRKATPVLFRGRWRKNSASEWRVHVPVGPGGAVPAAGDVVHVPTKGVEKPVTIAGVDVRDGDLAVCTPAPESDPARWPWPVEMFRG